MDFAVPVRLQTFVAGTDDDGNEAVAFGFAYEGAGERERGPLDHRRRR